MITFSIVDRITDTTLLASNDLSVIEKTAKDLISQGNEDYVIQQKSGNRIIEICELTDYFNEPHE